MRGERLLDDLLVFFRFDAAGGIKNPAAGFDEGERVAEQGGLFGGEFTDVIRLQSPAGFGAFAENAGVRAGNIEEDGVEFVRGGECFAGGDQPGFDVRESEPPGVFLDAGEAVGVNIGRENRAAIVHEFGQMRGFRAGGGAEIKHAHAGLGV